MELEAMIEVGSEPHLQSLEVTLYWLGKRAEAQIQQGLPPTLDETYS